MKRGLLIGMVVLAVAVAIGGGVWLYDWVLGATQTASGPLSAPTLAAATLLSPSASLPKATPSAESEALATESPAAAEETEAPAVTQETDDPAQAADPTAGEVVIYQINQDGSEAHFNIFEELRGAPKDVIGTTNQIAGQVAVNLNDLSTAQVGEILINARALTTDDSRRNQAIRNRILFTDQYEFIRFQPTQISGLSGSAAPGQTFTFQISGDLTIKDVTHPIVFDVTAQVESDERISGLAKATISRADFNLIVPSVPFVANVGDNILLEISFVLTPVAS
ncbi:MAG: YceI family protein [Anaerolineales bacterium]|nr:YceI family protein [Anaerolineales bacterium]